MRRLAALLLPLTLALLTGCAATVQRPLGASTTPLQVPPAANQRVALLVKPAPALPKSTDWELFRTEWRTAVSTAASSAGKQFDYYEAQPGATATPGTLVVVTINDYRYLSPGARYGFGVMTGNAYIDAEARFYELPSQRELGQRKYATSSSAWEGIFSAMTDKQVQAIAAEMIKEIDRR